jgi:hypothetical protein
MTAFATATARRHAIRLWQFTGRIGLHEVVAVVVSFLVYFVIRGAVVGRAGEAMVRGIRLIDLEQRLGIYRELEMQSWILDNYWLIKAMNWIYFWGHMPLIIVFAVWLYVWRRHTYTLVRNAFLASGAIAVVVYWLFPVAPPRLIPFGGYIDTMAAFDRVGYNAQETRGFLNEFAAVPSLHFGWSLLLGLAVARVGRRPILWVFGISWPVAMFFAVIMTGNHFILDAVLGGIVSFAGLGVAFALEWARPRATAWARTRLAIPEASPAGTEP